MTKNQILRGIIFDFDGVIVDSLNLHLEAWAYAVSRIFRTRISDPSELKGYGTRTIAGILAKKFGDPSQAKFLVKAKDQFLADNIGDIPLITGAKDFLEDLQRQNAPFGIASNSHRDFVHSALEKKGLKVKAVVCGDEVSRPKPKPDIYWECARRLGFTPKDYPHILVFEDTEHGVKAAISAQMIAVGVSTDISTKRLLEAGAANVCKNLVEAAEKYQNLLLINTPTPLSR